MRVVMEDLELDRLWVIYPGTRRYTLEEGVECIPLELIGAAFTDRPPPP